MIIKTIAIIPARGGSKRLLNKNILPLDGLPLIAHSILYAQSFNLIDEVFVTTDDIHIKSIALEYGAKVIDRPLALAGDFEQTVSALKHVLENIDASVENLVLLQPTNPLRPKDLLTEAFSFFEKQQLNSLFTVSRHHHKLGKIIDERFIPFNYKIGQRSQDLEPLFFENGLLYITKASNILNDEIITADAYPFIVDHPFANIDIDTQTDFDYASFLLEKFKNRAN